MQADQQTKLPKRWNTLIIAVVGCGGFTTAD